MINFFRKIRKKLADDNKPLKYMRYAIGEIALVVIGILIAISINNWNENQKDRKAENEALINLKLEFDENQNQLDLLIEIRKTQEKDCRTYIDLITDTTIPISQKIVASTPDRNTMKWGASNTVLYSLVNSGGIDRIQNDSLKFLLTKWPTQVSKFNIVEERVVNSLKRIKDYENRTMPGTIVKEGNYRPGVWPGNYYPPGISEKIAPMRKKLIDDIRYYNLFADLTNDLYAYSINGTRLRNDYERISRLIIEELNNRGIQNLGN